MRKVGYDFIHFVQLIRFFGFIDATKIFLKIIFSKKYSIIDFISRSFKNRISIRKADSDIEIFYQVFCELQYDILFHLDFKPINIIDCGSNVGFSCLYFATKFPDAKIIAVEPEIKNFNQLKYNTTKYSQIISYNAAIWHEDAQLTIKEENEWSASFEVVEVVQENKFLFNSKTINQLADENSFSIIDILKIDIEGAEYTLFNNNPHSWLGRTRCLIIELHDALKPGTSKLFFREMAHYNWRTVIKGENIICFRENF